VARLLAFFRSGSVGFIDWLDGGMQLGVDSLIFIVGFQVVAHANVIAKHERPKW
jgi:hypothetical protein